MDAEFTHSPAAPVAVPAAGVAAGVIAAAAYLAAQMTFNATVLGGAGWEPLQRIAAILLGPDAAPPPVEISARVIGIALIIHFALGGAFGRVIDIAVGKRSGTAAVVAGAIAGAVLYGVNYWLIAPVAFEWFVGGITTFIDHLLFGGLAALVYTHLRPRMTAFA